MDDVVLSSQAPLPLRSERIGQLLSLRREVGAVPSRTWQRLVRARDPVCALNAMARESGTGGRSSSSSSSFPTINRATWKMREIALLLKSPPTKVALLAEAPGGFLQACRWRWPQAECIATSLERDGSIPFDARARDAVLRGLPHAGDLCTREAAEAVVRGIGAAECDLVTADGGAAPQCLDTAEQESMRLVLAQVAVGLRLQRPGGSLVVKIFEGSTHATRDLFGVLVALYDVAHLVKPKTSKAGNSERYIVCSGLRDAGGAAASARRMHEICEQLSVSGTWVHRLCSLRNARVDQAFDHMIEVQCCELRSLLAAARGGEEAQRTLAEARMRDAEWLLAQDAQSERNGNGKRNEGREELAAKKKRATVRPGT